MGSKKVLTQEQRVLNHMREHGSITRISAMLEVSVSNLTAVISDLRKKGYEIETIDVPSINRLGQKVSYAKYVLKENKEDGNEFSN